MRPVLGTRTRVQMRAVADLVILLTPTIMSPGQVAVATAREQERLYEAQQRTLPVKKQ